jgi:PhzF family phenazine biosynthesis protein
MSEVLRLAAFTDVPEGGNPAGVVLDARGLDDAAMQAIAAEVGASETAFAVPGQDGAGSYDVRFFSPQAEVPFCGHATVATAVALARRGGPAELTFRTPAGPVTVLATPERATLVSVEPSSRELPDEDLAAVLDLLGWRSDELDPALPPRIAFAGAHHLVLAAATRERLAALDYDFDGLRSFMLDRDLTTVDLVWRAGPRRFHARNAFPVGGVVEDPATGAAAAAFGGLLRELGLVTPPATIEVLQGEDLGRPSHLTVELVAGDPRVRVSGGAVEL